MAPGSSSNQVRYELVVEAGPRRGEVIAVDKPVLSVGRQLVNDVVLPDERVSRQHARLDQGADGLYITDIGSSNGTYVNSVPIQAPTRLQPGDVVEVGGSRLVVRATPAREPPSAGAPTELAGWAAPEARSWEAAGSWSAAQQPESRVPSPSAAAEPVLGSSAASGGWEVPAVPPAQAWPGAAEGWAPAATAPPPLAVRAGFGRRTAAYLLDAVILAIPTGILNFIILQPAVRPIQGLGATVDPSEAELAAAVSGLFEAIVVFLAIVWVGNLVYYVLGWTKAGFTPGQKLMGLRVVNAAGRPPSFVRAILRFLFLYFLPVITLISILMVLGNEKRGLHDRVAGTYVVHQRALEAGHY